MTDLSNLLDQAWQFLANGDRAAAERLFRELRAQAPGSPEVIGLGAALLAATGAVEEAVAELQRAIELAESGAASDEVRVRLLLDAAELQLYALDDPEAAIESCQHAIEFCADDAELIDGILLESEAFLALGDHDDEVRALLAELDGCSIDDPTTLCRAGDQYALLGDLDQAVRRFEEAVARDPACADAHHGLGLIYETQGRDQDRLRAFVRTRELDVDGPRPAWRLSEEAIEAAVESALAELPDEVRALLGNVPIFVEDVPDGDMLREGLDPRVLGLFSGLPLPHRSHITDGQQPTLERIQIFARNLERVSTSPEQFCAELRITVLHETAHFFGLEDDDLHDIGLG